jgi:hypothetical protein
MYQDDIALVDQGSEEKVILQLGGNAIPDEVKTAYRTMVEAQKATT